MGYYSNFDIADTDIPNIGDVLSHYTQPYDWYDGSTYGKWYDWVEDLQQFAFAYPNNFLIIVRYGEENTDIERAIVRNGMVKLQRPNISWPPE